MSALDEVKAALRAAAPVKAGRDRVVLLGIAAERSVIAHTASTEGRTELIEKVDGVPIHTTSEFDGWAIRDVDKRGRWHDVGRAA